MDRRFFIIVDLRWLLEDGSHPKRVKIQNLCPLGPRAGHLADGCNLLVKYRIPGGSLEVDDGALLKHIGNSFCIRSETHFPQVAPEISAPTR